jgi:hypothetical protein
MSEDEAILTAGALRASGVYVLPGIPDETRMRTSQRRTAEGVLEVTHEVFATGHIDTISCVVSFDHGEEP